MKIGIALEYSPLSAWLELFGFYWLAIQLGSASLEGKPSTIEVLRIGLVALVAALAHDYQRRTATSLQRRGKQLNWVWCGFLRTLVPTLNLAIGAEVLALWTNRRLNIRDYGVWWIGTGAILGLFEAALERRTAAGRLRLFLRIATAYCWGLILAIFAGAEFRGGPTLVFLVAFWAGAHQMFESGFARLAQFKDPRALAAFHAACTAATLLLWLVVSRGTRLLVETSFLDEVRGKLVWLVALAIGTAVVRSATPLPGRPSSPAAHET